MNRHDAPPPRRRVIRSPLLVAGGLLFGLPPALAFWYMTVFGFAPDAPPVSPAGRIAMAIFGGSVLFVGIRIARIRITLQSDGLTVVNLFRTEKVSWGNLDRFELREGASWAYAVLRDGTRIGLSAVQPGYLAVWGVVRSRAHNRIAELDEALAMYSGRS